MKREILVIASIALLSSFQAIAANDQSCLLSDQTCQFPDGGPWVHVSAKVFPQGFGVEITVMKGKLKMDDAVIFAVDFAREVMAFRGWCLKGYMEMPVRGNDEVGRMLTYVCKQ